MSIFFALLAAAALTATQPHLVYSPPLKSPPLPAVWDGVTECSVPIELAIAPNGRVTSARTVDFSGLSRFARTAMENARGWVFEPQKSASTYRTTIVFSAKFPNGGKHCDSRGG
jgi:TonB family protein